MSTSMFCPSGRGLKPQQAFATSSSTVTGDVNLDVLRDILENHLEDLEEFARAIRGLLRE